ncbi:ATP-binding protein [Coraliomargarita sp. W4R53]
MKSLSARLTLWYALVVTLTVAALLSFGRLYLEHNLVTGIDLLNEVEFEEIRLRMDQAGVDATPEELIEVIKRHAELDAALYFFQVGRGREELFYKSSNLGHYSLPKEVHGSPRVTVRDDELGLLRSLEVTYAGLDIHVVSSMNNADAVFNNYEQTSFYVGVGVFLFSLLLGFFLSRLAIRPIAAIQRSAQLVSASNFTERIPVPNTGDEVERMAILLNAMLDRLEVAYLQVKRFTAEASHEFRTPLSIIRLQTERLLAHPELTLDERETALAEQMEEVERLNKMIDDLLFLAKADAGVIPLSIESVDLSEFLADFKSDADLLTGEFAVVFSMQCTVSSHWQIDPRLIRQVLLNLLSNALEVSKADDVVQLVVSLEDGMLSLKMKDQGAGLSDSQIERMFNRFERLGSSSHSKGNGLGLAICRSIVERHSGSICAYNRQGPSGLVVEVRLPDRAVSS